MAPAPLLVLQPQPHDVIGQRVDLWPWLPLQQILGSTADVLAGQHERRRLWPQECALGCGSLVDRFVAAVGSDKGSRGAILNGEQVNVVIGAPHHLRWSYCAARPRALAGFVPDAMATFVSDANGSRVENCRQLFKKKRPGNRQAKQVLWASVNLFQPKPHRPTSLPSPLPRPPSKRGRGLLARGPRARRAAWRERAPG